MPNETCASLTVGAVDAGVLVVAEKEAVGAQTLVAPHGVDAHLLAPTVVVHTLVHICHRWRHREASVSKVRWNLYKYYIYI